MEYGAVKILHILSAIVLFGTGLGTAYFMWSANRSRDPRVIAEVSRHVVRADWLFTTPTVVIQPFTGIWLVHFGGYPWTAWLTVSLVLYVVAGLCWLPVVYLQLRMRHHAEEAQRSAQILPEVYWRYARIWFWLGVPAFLSMVAVVALMVLKPG